MDSARLNHLLKAGVVMAAVCPEVSRELLTELQLTAATTGVTLDRATTELACATCGALAVKADMRTALRRTAHGRAGGTVLRARCSVCHVVRRREVGKRPINGRNDLKTTPTPAKKKGKKKKRAAGKVTPATDAGSTSFNLGDFLSTLS